MADREALTRGSTRDCGCAYSVGREHLEVRADDSYTEITIVDDKTAQIAMSLVLNPGHVEQLVSALKRALEGLGYG